VKFRTIIIFFGYIYGTISFYIRKNPTVSYILDPGKAQSTTSLIPGAFLNADFYGTFNSTTLNQIKAGFRLIQQLDAVLQYRRQGDRDQMAKRFKRCYIFELVIFYFIFSILRYGMMSQPETRLEGGEDNKNRSLNYINCYPSLEYLTFHQLPTLWAWRMTFQILRLLGKPQLYQPTLLARHLLVFLPML